MVLKLWLRGWHCLKGVKARVSKIWRASCWIESGMMTGDRVCPILYLAIAKAGNWANLCDYWLRAAISNSNFPPDRT